MMEWCRAGVARFIGHLMVRLAPNAVVIPLMVAPLIIGIAICGSIQVHAGETLDRITRTRVVRIGYAPEPPYAYRSPDGRVTGEAPEIARRIFARMGIREIQAVETEFGALIRDLTNGRFDVIATGMYILRERCGQIAFSEPTYRAANGLGPGLGVRVGNPRGLHGYDDIAAERSVRLGVVAGTFEHILAQRAGVRDSQMALFPNVVAAARGVVSGRVDAFAATSASVEAMVERNHRIIEEVARFRSHPDGETPRVEHGGFGFRKQDDDLRRAFDAELRKFVGTPEHLDVVARFGVTRMELPTATTAELCAR
jgi:polar amino acid transport system substrate-binding protein